MSRERYNGIEIQESLEVIVSDKREWASNMVRDDLLPATAGVEYGPFFAQSLALLGPWWKKLAALGCDWSLVMHPAAALDGGMKEKHLGRNVLTYGYRGVGEYFDLEVLH